MKDNTNDAAGGDVDSSAGASLKIVDDVVRVLDRLATAETALGVRGLAKDLGISRSTCHRILATLQSRGLVEQLDVSGQYTLGPHLTLYCARYRQSGLLQTASVLLDEMSARTGESACLYLPVPGGRIAVLQSESQSELRWAAQIGRVYPFTVGAAGKVILAHMSTEEISGELAAVARERGYDAAAEIERELASIRQDGFAISYGENIAGVYGAACAVLNHAGRPVASVSIYGPSMRVDQEALLTFKDLLVSAAARLSEQARLEDVVHE